MLMGFCFTGCDSNEEFPYPLPEKKLVTECVYQTGEKFIVKVFLPKALNDTTNYEYRTDCKVEIQAAGSSTDILKLDPVKNYYVSSKVAQPASFYKLKIEDPVYGVITGEDIVSKAPVVVLAPVSFDSKRDTTSKGVVYHYEVKLNMPLSDGLSPLYYNILLTERLKQTQNGQIIERNTEISNFSPSISTVDILYHKSGVLIEGISNAQNNLDLKLSCSSLEIPGKDSLIDIKLDIRSTSSNYFLYYNSINNQIAQSSNPFEPPSPLYSNIKNGLGIFGGYNSELRVLNLPAH
jgi:hypothetical protein